MMDWKKWVFRKKRYKHICHHRWVHGFFTYRWDVDGNSLCDGEIRSCVLCGDMHYIDFNKVDRNDGMKNDTKDK